MEAADAERQFVEAARPRGRLTNEDPAANHAAYDQVVAARKALRAQVDEGRSFLLACLFDKDLSVVGVGRLLPFAAQKDGSGGSPKARRPRRGPRRVRCRNNLEGVARRAIERPVARAAWQFCLPGVPEPQGATSARLLAVSHMCHPRLAH
jgi:hypothetical protein